MKTIFLSTTTCTTALAAYFLDKAVKYCTFHQLGPLTHVCLPANCTPEQRYDLQSMATLHGLFCQTGEVPETPTPFQFFLDDTLIDLRYDASAMPLIDWHAHTQFAYCARGIDLRTAAELSLALGVSTQGFSEHAFALYFPSNALKFYWQNDPDFVQRIWDTPQRGRMAAYREFIRTLKHPHLRFGLEIDLFSQGRFCLAPEDAEGWDYFIGAIHEIVGITSKSTQQEVESAWMSDVEKLLTYPIKILAHPFRYFSWYDRPTPRHFYKPVARALAHAGIAAEINHHQNPFELDFFRECLAEGVKLSFGTDAHITRNIADLLPHLETLQQLGLTTPELCHKHLLLQ